MFAVTGGTPSASRVGKVTSVPDPTTVLMPPAHTPATTTIRISHHDTPASLGGRPGVVDRCSCWRYARGGAGGASGPSVAGGGVGAMSSTCGAGVCAGCTRPAGVACSLASRLACPA